jgi:methylglutaconyl-CoA hydratase
VSASKDLVAHVGGREINHGLMEETAKRIARARVGAEGQEGVRAFLERRPPVWAKP